MKNNNTTKEVSKVSREHDNTNMETMISMKDCRMGLLVKII
jgi:hypothetical protein